MTQEPCYHPNLIITSDVIILDIVIVTSIPIIIIAAIFSRNTIMGLVNRETTKLMKMTIIQKVIDRGERGGGDSDIFQKGENSDE